MPLSSSILARLQYQHETINELINGFTTEQLKQYVNPGKWSVFENIVHLVAYQPTFIHRIDLTLQGNEPRFERYTAENDPLFYEYLQRPLDELLRISTHDRSFIRTTMEGLTENQLTLIAIHPKFGPMTLIQWTDFFLLHEAHHLWTIFQLVSTFRATQQ